MSIIEEKQTSSSTIPTQPSRTKKYVAAFMPPLILGAGVIGLWYYLSLIHI